MVRRTLLRAMLILVAAALTTPCVGSVRYRVVDLGTLGVSSHAYDISDSARVVGDYNVSQTGFNEHPFVWQDGTMSSLLSTNVGTAKGINRQGEIAGNSGSQSLIWRNGVRSYLGNIGGTYSFAEAINNSSQIVGWAETSTFYTEHAFVWQNNVMTDLGTLGGTASHAYGINNLGQVVGWSDTENSRHGFVWQNNTMTALSDAGFGEAYAINDSGVVVGRSTFYACIWQNNVRTDVQLAGLWSQFVDVNNRGQAVGYDSAYSHAYLYASGVLTELNTTIAPGSGWQLKTAEAINDAGYIVGSGVINGQTHAYMLVPVPEPSSLAVLALGLLGVMWRRKIR